MAFFKKMSFGCSFEAVVMIDVLSQALNIKARLSTKFMKVSSATV